MIEISCDMLLRRERKQLFPRRDDGPGDSIGLCNMGGKFKYGIQIKKESR